jgi:replication-associated recombination protein RarA
MSGPWVEKYRPCGARSLILDNKNAKFLDNVIHLASIPNLLLHGSPGTGKTTAAESIVARREELGINTSVLRLNASDERGLSAVKETIWRFVNSKSIYTGAEKIVILDEVDYMTPAAHDALHQLISTCKGDICFILICNYLFRITRSLRSTLIHLRFCAPPRKSIVKHLFSICELEKCPVTIPDIEHIVERYYPDIRSMMNAVQYPVGIPLEANRLSLTELFLSTKETRLGLLRKEASNLNSSAVAVAQQIVERSISNGNMFQWGPSLAIYCDFVKLANESEELAESHFCLLFIPSLALSEHIDDP